VQDGPAYAAGRNVQARIEQIKLGALADAFAKLRYYGYSR
jgi:hypothetical protein